MISVACHPLCPCRPRAADPALVSIRAFQAAAYACVPAGQWSVIQVLISEATVSCTNSRETPGVAPGVRWEMRRALLAGLAFAGRWKMALDELRDMYGADSEHGIDDSNVVVGDDDPDDFDRNNGVRGEGLKGFDGVGVRQSAVERRGDEKRRGREDEDKAPRLVSEGAWWSSLEGKQCFPWGSFVRMSVLECGVVDITMRRVLKRRI